MLTPRGSGSRPPPATQTCFAFASRLPLVIFCFGTDHALPTTAWTLGLLLWQGSLPVFGRNGLLLAFVSCSGKDHAPPANSRPFDLLLRYKPALPAARPHFLSPGERAAAPLCLLRRQKSCSSCERAGCGLSLPTILFPHLMATKASTGSVNVTVVPLPSVLESEISPLWACMISLAMARPSPVPPISRERALSTL